MKITDELVEFLDKYNGHYKDDDYINTEFRVYYVIKDRNIKNSFCINRANHTLAQANRIAKELMDIMYDDSFTCEYTRQISEDTIKPYHSTGNYEYLEHAVSLYIL